MHGETILVISCLEDMGETCARWARDGSSSLTAEWFVLGAVIFGVADVPLEKHISLMYQTRIRKVRENGWHNKE